MPPKNATAAATDEAREVVITRVFDAPRELVFKAWTDPKHVQQWWGPHGFTNPVCEMDVRTGGAIRIDMRAPDGTIYPNVGRFREIVPPERLVFTSGIENLFEVLTTVTFTEQRGKTLVTLQARPISAPPEAAKFLDGMKDGWTQSLERLENLLSNTVDREITAIRLFNAPRELVFSMWTDPKHIERWWGPRGFTTTTQEMDFRPGGVWRHVMHGPDGTDYQNKILYREIVAPERIVYSQPPFESTVIFSEESGKTRVSVRMVFESAELRDKVAKEFGAVEGLQQTLGRLEEELSKMSDEFVISRTFDAPRDLMWKAWTESDRLAKWFGPKGVTIFHSKNDLRPGGVYHYGMRTADGNAMWGKWIYREVVKPERLVFVVSFSDEKGGITRHPLAADWPLEMLSTVTFEERQGKTTVTVRWSALNATEAERKAFAARRDGMKQGWTGTFDQLEAYLKEAE